MKKFTKTTVRTVAICFAALFFTLETTFGQTAPIPSGSSSYNGDLYHSNGDIGIGTSSPSARIHIFQPAYSGGSSYFSNDYFRIDKQTISGPPPGTNSILPIFIIKSDGNVGIGIDNPLYKFHFFGDRMRIETPSGYGDFGAQNTSWFHITTDREKFYFNKRITVDEGIISSYNEDLQLQTSQTTRVTIKNTTGDVILSGGNLVLNGSNSNTPGVNEIKLEANTGQIRAREVKVDLAQIPDYVFDDDYNLLPLEKVKAFIQENGHLPNVKSEAQFQEEGSISLTEMNLKLLEKVEELTLYIIQQEERIKALENGGVK